MNNFIAIFKIDNETFLSIAKQSREWYIEKKDGKACSLEEKTFVSALKIFENSPNDFLEGIKSKLVSVDLPADLSDTLPLSKLIIFCIEYHMEYWLGLSIPWLKYMQVDEQLQVAIHKMQKQKYSQSLKHALLKYVNQSRI